MHVRTFKLAKFCRGLYSPLNRDGTGMRERAGVKGSRGEGNEKVEGMTDWDWGGGCATAAGGIDATASYKSQVVSYCITHNALLYLNCMHLKQVFKIHIPVLISFLQC